MENEIEYYAISMAQRIIEEAKTRKFDLFAPPQDFTAPWSLGPANYESYPLVNDVDDYHRFDRTINTPQGPYRVQVQVYYVEETNIDHIVSHRTNYKKMTVTVTSDYLSHPIVLNHVFSYISKWVNSILPEFYGKANTRLLKGFYQTTFVSKQYISGRRFYP